MPNQTAAKHNPFLAANQLDRVEFTIGSQSGTTINVGIQLKDSRAKDLAQRGGLFCYLSTDAEGDDIVATAPDGGWTIGTDGVLIPVVADKAAQLVSEADGDIDLDIVEAGQNTFYVIAILPDGTIQASDPVAFTTTTTTTTGA